MIGCGVKVIFSYIQVICMKMSSSIFINAINLEPCVGECFVRSDFNNMQLKIQIDSFNSQARWYIGWFIMITYD